MKNFSFTKNKNIFFILTAIMIIAGICSFVIRGFNFDIEFVGGTEISYDLKKPVEKSDEEAIVKMVTDIIGADNFSSLRIVGDNKNTVVIRTKLVSADDEGKWDAAAADVEAAVKELYPDSTTVSSAEGNSIFSLYTEENAAEVTEDDTNAITEALTDVVPDATVTIRDDGTVNVSFDVAGQISEYREAISTQIKELYPDAVWESTDTVSAEVSTSLKKSAVVSAVAAIALMLLYIAFRFDFGSAFAAVLCLAHDVFVMLVAYSLFQIPVGSTVIATVLTILGYSINATIIIFDRIREDIRNPNLADLTDAELANGAIAKTLGRTILTTITTLVMVVALAVLSVSAIQDFILPIIFGLIAGAFSSVLLAPAVWTMLRKTEKKIKAKRDAKKGYQGAKKATE